MNNKKTKRIRSRIQRDGAIDHYPFHNLPVM